MTQPQPASSADLAEHYRHGTLASHIEAALRAVGKDPAHLVPADLAAIDEFHIGGVQATRDLAAQLPLTPGAALLDIGSGIGGPARYFAARHGCRVTGIDITAEYVAVATLLTEATGLADRVAFRHASALDLPFGDERFDGATLLHVGMNVADKAALFAAVRRALRPGGFFAIYDVMRVSDGAIAYPVPWASGPEISFVATSAEYGAALATTGFTVVAERDRTAAARDFFAAMRARAAKGPPSPLALSIVMGPTAGQKVANLTAMVETGVLAPVEIIARAD
jgi:MPBQ/MSBQ methyltransferase